MSEIIERAARALGEVYDGYADPGDTPNNWTRAVEGVRAVLLAIREPTDAMIIAAMRKGQEVGYTDIIAVHRAIIDAALATEEIKDQ